MGNSPNYPGDEGVDEKEDVDDEEEEGFTCEICIEPSSNRFKNKNKCSHPYCIDCMIRYIRVSVEDNSRGTVKCPALDCDQILDPVACAPIIGDSLYSRWCDALCMAAIIGVERCYCPATNCNSLILNECGEKTLTRCTCPNCKELFCYQCRCVWHAGFGCDDGGHEYRDANEVSFGRVVEENAWSRCPVCKHFVELSQGCRYVKCRCGVVFCYKCGMLSGICHCARRGCCCCFIFLIIINCYIIWRVCVRLHF